MHKLMCDSDLLILPSRFDGWGAVVNESLMCGTPVICSHRCGAKDLLMESWRGEIVPSCQPADWTEAMQRWISKDSLLSTERKRIQEWSRCISGRQLASYFNSILDHLYLDGSAPVPPWMK